MQNEPTAEQKEFMEKINQHRKEKVEELAGKMLVFSLKANIPVMDLPYYCLQRAKTVIQDAYNSVDFKNTKLHEARKKFLKECLTEMKKNVKVLPKLPKEHVKDATETRDEQCEPVVQELVSLLLDEKLVFSDEYYFDKVLQNEEGIPLNASIAGYASALDDKLLMAISESWKRATDKLFGVEKEVVTMSMLDDILKGVPENK